MKPKVLLLIAALLTSLACNSVGPRAVRTARQPYNEAMAMARDQEILWNLLRIAEGRKPHFLNVENLVTKYKFNAGASIGLTLTDTLALTDSTKAAGVNDAAPETTTVRVDTDADALTTSASGAWEEQPTVTYKPLDGEDFSRRLLAPVSLENLAFLFEAGFDGELLVELFVSRAGEFFEDDPRLVKFGSIIGTLQRGHHLQFLAVAGEPTTDGKATPPRVFIALKRFDNLDLNPREVCQFLCLLPDTKCEGGFKKACSGHAEIGTEKYRQATENEEVDMELIPFQRPKSAQKVPDKDPQLLPLIQTRSLTRAIRVALGIGDTLKPLDLMQLCSQPQGQTRKEKDEPAPRLALSCSSQRPNSSTAYLSVSYRGKWFSIPMEDDSRQAYLLFSLVYTMQAAKPVVSLSPQLVIPVG